MADERNTNMFESLRLSSGGGLVSAVEKVAQSKKAANIAIGIGGTGLDAIRMFKKTVYERVKQDNWDKRETEAPQYSRIRFMEIDSDSTQIESSVPQLDFSKEFKDIGVASVVQELEDTEKIKNTPHLSWLNQAINARRISQGAGGIRQVGKYLLTKKASELYADFKNMINNAVRGLPAPFDLNIYIMAGIGGGTGSGCFLDVCYIMNQVLVDLGYDGTANVLGFFFLPDVNLSNPNFPLGGPHESAVKENGYAALKELDYVMNIPANGDVYEQEYNETFRIKLAKPPVTFCHLLSTKSIAGAVIQNGYDYIMNVVAEYALNFVVHAEEAAQQGQNSGITLRGIMANIDHLVERTYKAHGTNYVYNILGTSCATVPYKEIGTYLAIRFFDSIKYIQNHQPNRAAVEALCRNVGFNTQSLTIAVKTKVSNLTIDPGAFDTRALKAANVGEIDKSLSQFCENWKDRYLGQVTTNVQTLERELDKYEPDEKPESVIGKVFKELMSLTRNPEYGPCYAASMLKHATNHTIASELAGIKREITEKREHATGQSQFRWIALEKAQTRFNTALADPFNVKKNEYVKQVEAWYQNQVDIAMYNSFLGMLDKIKERLDDLEKDYFQKYVRILNKLITTFEDNQDYFKTFGMGNKMYTWSIVEIDSIKSDLDAIVAQFQKKNNKSELIAPNLVDKFNTMMITKSHLWFDENEVRIAEMISEFIRLEFDAAMTKSMLQYLQDKFACQGNDLVECIADKVIKDGLVDKATPMFDMNPTIIDVGNKKSHAEYIMLTVPNGETTFVAAADQCRKKYQLDMGISQTVLTDRIFMLEFFSGIPMFAYRELPQYETTYYQQKTKGVHLNEGEHKNWNSLPSPIPGTYSAMGYTRIEQQKVDDIIKLYESAVEKNIIHEEAIENQFEINIYKNVDYSAVFKEGWDESIVSKNATKNKLLEEQINLQNNVEKKITILSPNFAKTHLDTFINMPKYVELVRKEIEKMRVLDSKIQEVEKAILGDNEVLTRTTNFIRAITHSVIVKSRSSYKYSFEKRGDVEDIILTLDSEQYENIPVYRAFVNYQNLDKEVLEQISSKVKDASKNITDEMYKNTVDFFDFYKSVRKDYIDEAKSGKYVDAEEIVNFLETLYDSVDKFIINNK